MPVTGPTSPVVSSKMGRRARQLMVGMGASNKCVGKGAFFNQFIGKWWW